MSENSFDVLVVGGGGSGLAAAVSAAENGGRVLLLEKRPSLGGTTGIAVGSFTANRTVYQQRAGIQDSLDAHAEDAGRFAPVEIEARNNVHLRRFFLELSAETLDWLRNMGLAFHGPNPEPPNRVPRMHNVVPNAKAFIAALQSRLMRLGGTILCDTTVRKLLTEAGRVIGVEACSTGFQPVSGGSMTGQPESTESAESMRRLIARRGVVLAAGDYANSPELIATHKGERFRQIEGINPYSTGEGHLMAAEAGAQLLNMDVTYGPELRFVAPLNKGFTQLLPTGGWPARIMGKLLPLVPKFVTNAMIKRLLVTWQHPENTLFDDGAILVNQHGERFCNEIAWPDREIALAAQPGKIGYILLDERLVQRYSGWPHFISTAPEIAYAYVEDYLRLRPDVAVGGSGLQQVARARGLPVEALAAAVEAYNRQVSAGSEDTYGRPCGEPLRGDRWVLLGPAKAYFTTTEGGAAIDEQMRVLNAGGHPIPGLYAAGQNGLGGQILWGHGLHIAWAITSGRLAGRFIMA